MKTNILFIAPNPVDATSWYRAYGPFGALRKELPGMNLVTGVQKFTWPTFQMTDITFMQRPFSDSHVQVAKMSKENNNKLWLDFDDDLFTVPQDNPAHAVYSSEKTQKNIAMMIAMADVVTVSTMFLKRRLERLNKNIVVINNALNDTVLKPNKIKPFSERPNLFNWRGSNTHQKDILANSEGILNNIEKSENLDWKWHWIGYNPWFITEQFKKDNHCLVSPSLDIVEYHSFISQLQPKAQIVPLHDCKFNRSKSNIAWIEATWSGAVTIAPDWEEWKNPGVFNYGENASFEEAINAVMGATDNELQRFLAHSNDYMNEHYLLSKVNQQRKEIIEQLMDS